MLLDLKVPELQASVRYRGNGQLRLTLDYPAEEHYRNRVLRLLSLLIQPEPGGDSVPTVEDTTEDIINA